MSRTNFNILLSLFISTFVFAVLSTSHAAAGEAAPAAQDFNSGGAKVLCLPGVYLDVVTDCRPDGPS
ncbi:MAG: hypothetical protein MUO62_07915, partial [Anaerolineales bacterium]|nr:hypothetical protein [Anaerolineales bacterium]